MKRKFLTILLILTLICSLFILTGCGNNEENTVEEEISDETLAQESEISDFNSTFTKYGGTAVSGSLVKSLASELVANAVTNSGNAEKLITVTYVDESGNDTSTPGGESALADEESYQSELTYIEELIDVGFNYSVDFTEYNDSGFISEITISYVEY